MIAINVQVYNIHAKQIYLENFDVIKSVYGKNCESSTYNSLKIDDRCSHDPSCVGGTLNLSHHISHL